MAYSGGGTNDNMDPDTDQEDRPLYDDDDASSTNPFSVEESEPAKDATEQELERLVFGDSAGFKQGLQSQRPLDPLARFKKQLRPEQALTHVSNDDLFFLDKGPSRIENKSLATTLEDQQRHENDIERGPPAWEDSDDDRLRVSLTSVPRLKKLRNFDGEDVVSGKEYTRRLRRQFEALHPTPEWAVWDAQSTSDKRPHKRRRNSNDTLTSDPESAAENETDSGSGGEDMEVDGDSEAEASSMQPLARLLRSTQPLTLSPSSIKASHKTVKLRPEFVAIERMKDLQPQQPHVISSLSIHPTLPLLLSSGNSSTLYLHRIQPYPTPPDPANPLLASLHLKRSPLSETAFSAPTVRNQAMQKPRPIVPKIYLNNTPRRTFRTWSLSDGSLEQISSLSPDQAVTHAGGIAAIKPSPCGRYVGIQGTAKKGGGVVNILDAVTNQWIAQAKAESTSSGSARQGMVAFAWWGDGSGMTLLGRDGELCEWALVSEEQDMGVSDGVWTMVARWRDEGQIGATCLAQGGTLRLSSARRKDRSETHDYFEADRYVATGSSNGIVNIYDRSSWYSSHEARRPDLSPPSQPKPLRTLMNLTTPITDMAFSPDGQLLAVASKWKRDALKLVHLPSGGTVYKNWPTGSTPLGRISALAVGEIHVDEKPRKGEEKSRKELMLCIGNEAGHLRGWTIRG